RRADSRSLPRRRSRRPHRALCRPGHGGRGRRRLAARSGQTARRFSPCARSHVRQRQLSRICEDTLMFTGIVTDVGRVASVSPLPEGIRLRIDTAYAPDTIAIGASIACAGVCLTVVSLPEQGSNQRWFEVEAWEEALRLTTA